MRRTCTPHTARGASIGCARLCNLVSCSGERTSVGEQGASLMRPPPVAAMGVLLIVLCLLCGHASAQGTYIGHRGKWRARMYEFRIAKLTARTGSYSKLMVAACQKTGMKPVCEHPNVCMRDYRALYLGQRGHLSHKYVKAANLPGFDAVRRRWNGLCFYGSIGNGNKALCNIPASSSAWKTPAQANPGFPCGKEGTNRARFLSLR